MPWARIPSDKLINLPMFNIHVVADDGDFVWMEGPSGKMRVNKMLPRVWFETIEDAHQAGAVGILITCPEDLEKHQEIVKAAEASGPDEGGES